MKKLLGLGLLLLAIVSCNDSQRYSQNSKEIDIVKATINHYDYQKWDSLVINYADTAKVYYNTRDLYFTAKNLPEYHIKNDSAFLTRAFEDDRREYEMITDNNGKKWVNFWGIWKATLNDTDENFVIPVHLTLKFVDNKIVEEWGYYDRSTLNAALTKIADAEEDSEVE